MIFQAFCDPYMKALFLIFLSILFSPFAHAQGIRGLITDENGEPMPYASIYIKEKGTGTSSNSNGYYELRLPPGSYEITFQFVGYATQVRKVQIANEFITLNLSLKPQSETLLEAKVTGSVEDPAYTIMRKAIAKAPYHLLQYDNYTAKVYMKGTGHVSKIPGLFQKMAASDGVDTDRVFTSESVSEISFEQPNTFKEKVVSVRTSGEDLEGANPNSYVNSSFYLPKVVESISPFSPHAFAYYRFHYLGNFEDRGYKIHKIEVIPRSPGDKVFDGIVYIRDKFWNIYSLDLHGKVEIFDLHITQFFAPVKDEIWMPITQKYNFSASFLGFAGEYQYMASVSDYHITKNDDLDGSVILVDEKIEEAPAEIEAIKKGEVDKGVQEVFDKDKEVSRKQFKKLLKEYDKKEKEEHGDEDVLSDYTYKIDSSAAKRDSLYWASIRPVPLTDKEAESYHKDDSIYQAKKKDSTKVLEGHRFQLMDVLLGRRYKLSDNSRIRFPGLLPRLRFNTVEGFNMDLEATLDLQPDTNVRWQITPTVRYGLSGTHLYAMLKSSLSYGRKAYLTSWMLEGGHFISQFQPNSIDPFINSIYSLAGQRNYMKLYEQDFVGIGYSHNFRYKWQANISAEWASRSRLINRTSYSVFDPEREAYSDNDPDNIETKVNDFKNSKAFTTKLELRYKPWLKFRKYNGRLIPLAQSSPEFRVTYNSGWEGLLGSSVDFQQIELGIKTTFTLGVRATLDLDVKGGSFLSNRQMLFMDYKHFDGDLTEIAPLDVTGNYRALDYYLYSTHDAYVSALSYIRFRKLLFTHIPLVRLSGVKENLFVNYLKTSNSPHYTEIGYGIDKIFRILRIEFVESFDGLEPRLFSIRIGVASIFSL